MGFLGRRATGRTGRAADGGFAEVVHVLFDDRGRVPTGDWAGRLTLLVLWAGDRPVAQKWVAPADDPEAALRDLFSSAAPVPAPEAPAARPTPTVSVVICTRDRPEELARCLASLPRQSHPPDEVIVVDNASTGPRTREVAVAAGVHYVREDRPGLDIARNTGLLAARSDLIAYTDDDTELHPRWLERLVAAFEDDEEVLAVTGLVLPAELDTEAQWIFESRWGFGRGFMRIDFGPDFYRAKRPYGCPAWEIGAGANMAFRRSVVDEVGLFDERLDVGAAGCSGDSEYWYRILAAGRTCRYEPSAVVFHHHRAGMAGLRSQIFHYMRGHVTALLVQYERTGDLGNLRRAFLSLPSYYLRRSVRRVTRGREPGDRVFGREVSGALAGVVFYLRNRRTRTRPAAVGGPR
ncbi:MULTISPECIES: glycosyltransferase family 2 protein [unclassified Blastococcus]